MENIIRQSGNNPNDCYGAIQVSILRRFNSQGAALGHWQT